VNKRKEMKERNYGGFTAIVKKNDDRTRINCKRDAHGDVVRAGLGFVDECARRFSTTGTWWAVWSNGCSNSRLDASGGGASATDVVIFVNRNNTFGFVKVVFEEFAAFIAGLPNDVAMAQDMHLKTEWLQENVVGGWGCFLNGYDDEDSSQLESHFLFENASDVILFKLRFG